MSGFSVVNTSTLTSVSALYQVTTAFGGNNVGDILQSVTIYNQQVNPAVIINTVWRNLTQQISLGAITPLAANIIPISGGGSGGGNVIDSQIYTSRTVIAPDYAQGDVVEIVTIYDPTTIPPTIVSTTYNNLTQGVANTANVGVGSFSVGDANLHMQLQGIYYRATASSSPAYNIGDILQLNNVTDTSESFGSYSYSNVWQQWNNITQQTYDISPVFPGEITPVVPLPSFVDSVSLYYAVLANTDYNVNDVIQQVNIYDPSTNPATLVSQRYNNLTQDIQDITIDISDLLPLGTPDSVKPVSSSALYVAKNGTGDFAIGDSLLVTNVFNSSTTPATLVSQTWQNLTAGTTIPAPSYLDIDPVNQETYVSSSNLYTCVSAYAGAAAGDILENVVTFDPTVTPPVQVGSTWNNLTQGTVAITAPTPTDVTPGTTQATSSNFAVTTIYTATALSAGNYNIGDILESIEVYNPATIPATLVSTLWKNLTQDTVLAAAPPITDITPGQAQQSISDTTYSAIFRVISAGSAGTNVGDILQRAVSINPVTSAVVSTVWNNLTAGTTIAAPAYVNLAPDSISSTPTYSTVPSLYYVITAGTGYAVNDILQEVITYDTASGGATAVTTVWNNLTQGTVLGAAPTQVNIKPVGTPVVGANYTAVNADFYAVNAGTGYAVDDQLIRTDIINMSSAAPVTVVSTTWFNLTQQTELAGAPLTADVLPGFAPATAQTVSVDTTALYVAVAASAGNYAIDDVIQQVVMLNPGTTPPTVLSTTYNNLTDGTANVTVSLADLVPVGAPTAFLSGDVVTSAFYAAKTANVGIGYAIGDTLQQVVITNPNTNAIVSTTWKNLTQGTVLGSAPTLSEITASQSQLPPALGPQTNSQSLSVYVANQSALSYFPVVTQYLVSTAFVVPAPGGAVGDVVQDLQVYDSTTNPATLISSTWSNLTTGASYASAPAIGNLTPTFGNGLTNAELRAAPVVVTTTPTNRVSAMISVGASTTAATAAGIVSASFYNNSTTVNATVAGGTLPPSTAISFQANDNDKLAAISYSTAVGGSLLIATLT